MLYDDPMSMTFTPEYRDGDDWDALPSVNMSNSNAFRVLRSLDIEADYCGAIDAADLVGRCALALAVGGKAIVDTADPASKALMAALSAGGATVHDCSGPLDAYLDARLPDLLWVAEAAQAMGRRVSWG